MEPFFAVLRLVVRAENGKEWIRNAGNRIRTLGFTEADAATLKVETCQISTTTSTTTRAALEKTDHQCHLVSSLQPMTMINFVTFAV